MVLNNGLESNGFLGLVEDCLEVRCLLLSYDVFLLGYVGNLSFN